MRMEALHRVVCRVPGTGLGLLLPLWSVWEFSSQLNSSNSWDQRIPEFFGEYIV